MRAQGGVLWKELNRETQLHGLATTGGVVASTGIAGLTLGGGWLAMCTPALRDSLRFVLPLLLLVPGLAQAQTTEQPSADIQQRDRIEQQLKELRDQQQALLNSMQQQVSQFNARIAAMEAELGVTPSKDQAAQTDAGAESSAPLPASAQDAPAQTNPDANGSTLALATPANSIMDVRGVRYLSEKQQGLFPYEPGKGFVLARGPHGEVDFFVKGYIRYLTRHPVEQTSIHSSRMAV